jgi:hypothetical protein
MLLKVKQEGRFPFPCKSAAHIFSESKSSSRASGMAQEVGHLPSNYETLSSNPSTTKERKKVQFQKHFSNPDTCSKKTDIFQKPFKWSI